MSDSAFDQADGLRMLGFGQPMLNVGLCAGVLDGMSSEDFACHDGSLGGKHGGPRTARVRGVDAVVGPDRVDAERRGIDQRAQDRAGNPRRGLLVQLDEGELRRSVDRHERCSLPSAVRTSANFIGGVDVKKPIAPALNLRRPGPLPSTSDSREMLWRCRQR